VIRKIYRPPLNCKLCFNVGAGRSCHSTGAAIIALAAFLLILSGLASRMLIGSDRRDGVCQILMSSRLAAVRIREHFGQTTRATHDRKRT
jgi:hypothetical protein